MFVYQGNKFGQICEMLGFLECSPSSPHHGRSGHVESGAMLDGTDKATPTKKASASAVSRRGMMLWDDLVPKSAGIIFAKVFGNIL